MYSYAYMYVTVLYGAVFVNLKRGGFFSASFNSVYQPLCFILLRFASSLTTAIVLRLYISRCNIIVLAGRGGLHLPLSPSLLLLRQELLKERELLGSDHVVASTRC